MICAIILAAGQSKRMGTAKLLLPFGDSTIIQTIIDNVRQSKIDEVLVVVGADREKIEGAVHHLHVATVFNPQHATGMLSSIQAGMAAVPPGAKATVVVLGDQPSLSPATIDRIIDAHANTNKGIVLPSYHRRRGHPILIDMKYKEDIQNLNPDVGLRELIRNNPQDIHEVEVGTDSILQDIDYKEDYKKEKKKHDNSP
ncbi:MAG: nucleotidyltransferase family protein [Candidatus Latescibacterota bacterium]